MIDKIIITTYTQKKELLKNRKLENSKIYTYESFKKLFYFDYNEKTLLYIVEKYHVKVEIAKIYIENLYYIEDKNYNSHKLNFLKQLKQELINSSLLLMHKTFKRNLNAKKIIFYNLDMTKEMIQLSNLLKEKNQVEIINEKNDYSHEIFEFQNLEEEVVYIATDIVKKIKSGISFKQIYLVNLDEEYRKEIKKIFPMFHIPFQLKENNSLFKIPIVKKFIQFYENNLENTLLKITPKNKEEQDIYNQLISIINKYAFEENKEKVKPFIIEDLKQTQVIMSEQLNSIQEATLEDTFKTTDYIYLVAFNQGIIPITYKEEDYLNDKEKQELSISSTQDKNLFEKEHTLSCIKNIKNLIITYKLNHDGNEYILSSLNEVLKYPISKNNKIDNQYSNLYNKIYLTSMLDNYYKYGTYHKDLEPLYSHYSIPYRCYDNQFTGIDPHDLKAYLNHELNISYTKLNAYYSCPFSYYIKYILKISEQEDTFAITIGNLFHAVLENYQDNFDFTWLKELKKIKYPFIAKEQLFLEQLKDELQFVINGILLQENYTKFHDELYEEKIIIQKEEDIKVTFSGTIDKLKYKKIGNKTLGAIIDYKTGSIENDLSLTPYGLHLQLPLYISLAKHIKKLNHLEVIGIYLQKILNGKIINDHKHSEEELKKKQLLLQGYSCYDKDLLSMFDISYKDSNLIHGMKTTTNGDFYAYTKILKPNDFETLENIAIQKLEEAKDNIKNANFKIESKKVGKKFDGCKYCTFQDICFYRRENTLELKELSLKDILGGD